MFKPHYPPHYYFDNKIYFLTARTVNKNRFFNNREKKNLFQKTFKEAGDKFKISIYAWVILDNHYHVLVSIPKGNLLPDFIQAINGKSAFLLNRMDEIRKRKVWFNYWDSCIRSEKDFWMRFNYIHHNPVKHQHAKTMKDYQFSSYNSWIKKKGIGWMNDVFEKYPIVDFTPENLHPEE